MGDQASTGLRERVWVTVIDHEADPPQPVREVFFENGVLQHDVSLTTTAPDPRPADDSAPQS